MLIIEQMDVLCTNEGYIGIYTIICRMQDNHA